MAETKYKLDGYYVIPDISSCISEFGVDGIMYESSSVYFPNMTDVDNVDIERSSDVLEFKVYIKKSWFCIFAPLKGSEVSMHDQWIDIQFPNGDFLVLRLGGKIEDIEWLHINNIDNGHVQGYGK